MGVSITNRGIRIYRGFSDLIVEVDYVGKIVDDVGCLQGNPGSVVIDLGPRLGNRIDCSPSGPSHKITQAGRANKWHDYVESVIIPQAPKAWPTSSMGGLRPLNSGATCMNPAKPAVVLTTNLTVSKLCQTGTVTGCQQIGWNSRLLKGCQPLRAGYGTRPTYPWAKGRRSSGGR